MTMKIMRIVNNLKNKSSYGYDCISNLLLKRAKNELIKPLTLIINQTINTGIFPEQLKISKVKPLFKKGDSTLFSNYRPISLLPSISKIFEYVIFKQLITYLNTNNLLFPQQFGFRPAHSTELAALKLVNNIISGLNDHKAIQHLYIDLSKAFDSLDHSILLHKLEYYGICNVEYCLLHSYLTNRFQYVEYEGIKSKRASITTGLPQGSILGPLLFLLYINDLPSVSNKFEMLMYANDTTLYCNLDQNSTSDSLSNELKSITNWLYANKLSLNIGKTKHMIYHNINKKVNYPVLTINNVEIERVTHFNFLGLVLDSQLNWKKHLDHISLKLSKMIGILHRLKFVYPETVLLILYNTLIVPHLTYCILSWGSLFFDNHRIHVLKKKGLRIVACGGYLSHTEPICKHMQLLKVSDMFRVAL